jgi:hypothetical protein
LGERMRIDNTGNVGIGTTGPGSTLSVNGGAQIMGTNVLGFGDSSTGYWHIGATSGSGGDLQITDYYNSTWANYRLTIKDNGNVGIGTTSPNANAILDVSSTTKAFMPPRMTTTQKNAVATPTAGMVVYDSTLNKLSVYTGAVWETVTSI